MTTTRMTERIPYENGSRSFSNSFASAFTKALPVITGSILPAARSSQRNLPVNVLPMMLSWIHASPSASLPSAARQASFALVPVPQGERSYALPGQSTKFREFACAATGGPKSST